MQFKYYPPTYEAKEFNCIFCQVYARQTWLQARVHFHSTYEVIPVKECTCSHCEASSYWHINGTLLYPDVSVAAPPHTDMPASCLTEYNEARAIFAKSPRAAAAMLRLCIQKLMTELGEKGKNINDDIKHLVEKGLPVQVQQALDYCRVVGNNGVHPGEIQLNDTPEMAQQLFTMVNFIVQDRITRPKEIQALYESLPSGAIEAIEKRDGKPT